MDISTQEVYHMGFSCDANTPHYWISTPATYVDECLRPLFEPGGINRDIMSYLGSVSYFHLDTENRFGFGRCATIEDGLQPDEKILRFYPRNRRHNRHLLTTLNWVMHQLKSLRYLDKISVPTNHQQVLEVESGMGFRPKSHLINGEIYAAATKALVTHRTEFMRPVASAMQCAWKKIAPLEWVQYANEAGIHIADDGRPGLTIFGFGITSGVIPQSIYDEQWSISSDNVDAEYQALVLLAGWFKLAETIRLYTAPTP